jgi:hypothetical protein
MIDILYLFFVVMFFALCYGLIVALDKLKE